MSALTEIEVCVLVNEHGEYAVESDVANLKDRYEADIGELDGTLAYRLVRLKVNVPTPTAAVATITVPDLPSDAAVTIHASKSLTPGDDVVLPIGSDDDDAA
jgi:hypothetical protein